jgi:hypothetical protein
LWKGELAGEERLFLTDHLLTIDGRELVLEGAEGKVFECSVFPAPETLHGGRVSEGAAEGVFATYRIDGPAPVPVSASLEQRRQAGPLRTIGIGPRGVAQRPEEQDFEQAAEWKISLDVPEAYRDRDLYLEIPYMGDVARVYLDGVLLTDNFYNGKPILLGLKRYAPQIYTGELTIRILPFQKEAPIYLQRGHGIDFHGAGSAVRLSEVTVYDNRQVRLTAE